MESSLESLTDIYPCESVFNISDVSNCQLNDLKAQTLQFDLRELGKTTK